MSTMRKPKDDVSAVPAAPDAAPDHSGALKPITGSRNGDWSRHLLDRTRDVIKHKRPKQSEDPKEDVRAEMGLTMAALEAFNPTDAVEGMIASQAVALHEASLHCFRLAMIPQQPFEIAAKCRKDGANLARAMVDMTEALERRRGKGPQVIRVEKMLIADGGQAVVGNVTTPAAPPATIAASRALEQGAPPMPTMDPMPVGAERGRG